MGVCDPQRMPARRDTTARLATCLPLDTAADVARLAAHDGITTSAWTAKILAAVCSLGLQLELPTR